MDPIIKTLFFLKHAFSIPIAHVPRGKQRYRSRHYYHYVAQPSPLNSLFNNINTRCLTTRRSSKGATTKYERESRPTDRKKMRRPTECCASSHRSKLLRSFHRLSLVQAQGEILFIFTGGRLNRGIRSCRKKRELKGKDVKKYPSFLTLVIIQSYY